MEPAHEPANNQHFLRKAWNASETHKPGETSSYEGALGPEGFPDNLETLFNGVRNRDSTSGRRLRDDNGHDINARAQGGEHAVLTPERIEVLKQTPRSESLSAMVTSIALTYR
jgi:hypothetical protein